jgi:hypothetical protein
MHRPGLQAFFWDKLPEGRVVGTFWAEHPPDYGLLAPSIPEAEELFQVIDRQLDTFAGSWCHLLLGGPSTSCEGRVCGKQAECRGCRTRASCRVQVRQRAAKVAKPVAQRRLAVLDLKRATAIGVVMQRMRYDLPQVAGLRATLNLVFLQQEAYSLHV